MGLTLNGENGIVYDNLNNDIKNLLMPKNWIINGMFDIWQRGTSQTSIGYGSDDRWFNYHSEYTKTHSRQAFPVGQTDVPNNPTYFSRTVITSVDLPGAGAIKIQRIEDVTKLAGKRITLSFWAKADANKNIAINFSQKFGTGGSADVGAIGSQLAELTTTWARKTVTVTIPSVSGKTIGAGSYLELQIYFGAGSSYPGAASLGHQSGTFDIALISLVEGSVAVECQNQPYADVLRDCLRYYQRITSEVNTGNPLENIGLGYNQSSTSCLIMVNHKVPLRVMATQVDYSNLALYNAGLVAITSIFIQGGLSNPNTTVLDVFSSGLAGVYQLVRGNTTNAYLGLSAEL